MLNELFSFQIATFIFFWHGFHGLHGFFSFCFLRSYMRLKRIRGVRLSFLSLFGTDFTDYAVLLCLGQDFAFYLDTFSKVYVMGGKKSNPYYSLPYLSRHLFTDDPTHLKRCLSLFPVGFLSEASWPVVRSIPYYLELWTYRFRDAYRNDYHQVQGGGFTRFPFRHEPQQPDPEKQASFRSS